MNLLLFTPLILEQQAVLVHLDHLTEELLDGKLYLQGEFKGKHQTFHITVVVTGSNNSIISTIVERAITKFQPSLVFLLGIAGGVKDVAIGDVVVGTKSYGYESGKETDKGFMIRPQVFPASQDLISLAQLVAHQNQWPQKIKGTHQHPKVIFGPIASGDKVITTTQSTIYQLLKQSYNDTTALEMEAFGFGQALHQHQNIRWLNVRGISDLLEGKNAADDSNHQPLAAATAAAFVFEMLWQFDVSQFNLPMMTTKDLTKAIYDILFPMSRLESTKDMAKELSERSNISVQQLWRKVQPLMKEEFEDLQANRGDEDAQAAIRSKLKRVLDKQEHLKTELENLVQGILEKNGKQASVVISNSKNVIQGSTISAGGNFHLGDVSNSNNRETTHYHQQTGGNTYIAETINIQQVQSEAKYEHRKATFNQQEIKSLIQQHKIKVALEQLILLTEGKDSDLNNQVILLASRWNGLQGEIRAGVVSSERAGIERSRIVSGLLWIVGEI